MIRRVWSWLTRKRPEFSAAWWASLERSEWRTVEERPRWSWDTWDRKW